MRTPTYTATPTPRCDNKIDDAVRHRMRGGLVRQAGGLCREPDA
jgi:hypothetical protein